MQITVKKIKPYVKVLLIIAAIATVVYIFWFFKYYFYPALTDSQTTSAIQISTAGQTVNISEFNNLVDSILQKASSTIASSTVSSPF
jgi:flagellar basal body-associated protein FliL